MQCFYTHAKNSCKSVVLGLNNILFLKYLIKNNFSWNNSELYFEYCILLF